MVRGALTASEARAPRSRLAAASLRALLFGALGIAAVLGASCSGSEEEPGPEPVFPASYAASFSEVRDCRGSTEHDFMRVRVLADPAAVGPYQGRDADFPVGSVVLKEQYDFADTSCSGSIVRWTVMQRLAEGSSPETLDWYWQDVDASRRVISENASRCVGCHTGCGVPPDGYEGTCTVVGGQSGGAFP